MQRLACSSRRASRRQLQVPVRIVLDDEDIVLAGKVIDGAAAVVGERGAGRVLSGRDRVQQLRSGVECIAISNPTSI